jgi:hypothetical protein
MALENVPVSPQWSIDRDIPWDRFEIDNVDPKLVEVVKAAALVESNAADYAEYLCNVFHDDPAFQKLSRDWAVEEIQHGVALGRWAKLADPTFDYEARFQKFREGYRIQVQAEESVRGSRTGELVARCIATDEWRHYAMFYKAMKRYLDEEKPNRLQRLRIAVSRVAETEDDELAYAFFAGNASDDDVYDRKASAKRYFERALKLYRPRHVERAMAMIFKAAGFEPRGRISRTVTRGMTMYMAHRVKRLAA